MIWLAGGLSAVLLVWSIASGRVWGRFGGTYTRQERPFTYWSTLTFYSILIILCFGLGLFVRGDATPTGRDTNGFGRLIAATEDRAKIAGAQEEAGRTWARAHRLVNAAACPADPPAFRIGCAGEAEEQTSGASR